MTLTLILENAPRPQAVSEMRHEFGDLSIGRGADADWQIDDPEMYISRRHCVIRAEGDGFTVIDASSGGLFIDGAETPLGAGNSAPLEDGMRLRLGDYVIRVAMGGAARQAAAPAPAKPVQQTLDTDDFFSTPVERPPETPRPDNMPPPFEPPASTSFFDSDEDEKGKGPGPVFDDPFTMDALPSKREDPAPAAEPEADSREFDFGDFFGDDDKEEAAPAAPEPEPEPSVPQKPAATSIPEPPREPTPEPVRTPEPEPAPAPEPAPEPPRVAEPAPAAPPPPAAASGPDDAAVVEAFLRGLGVSPRDLPQGMDTAEMMEAMGARMRLMIDGLQHLLRARAREKQDARIAQTIIGSTDVNPLKFAVTPDDAARALVGEARSGYLQPEDAITGAFRDIAEHNIDSWRGVQAALRRMIDRFEPESLEKEMQDVGLLERLIAGGRSAKLWDLYTERYEKIAKSAEERFLGDVGEDFRDAYERK